MRRLFEVGELLSDRNVRVVVTCGTGGVGKTSVSAALAVSAAEAGRHVVLITVDPAKRLATALGLEGLGGEPQPVPGITGGSLDALMLYMTQTFDDAVRSHAPKTRVDEVLRNPFYKALSTSFSGTQDYMATEKLGQLYEQARSTGRWDLIVVDTPPSRSALDFLDAPKRLGSFLDGRFIRLLAAPARVGGRAYLKVFTTGVNIVTTAMTKLLGGQMLADVQTFVAALDTMFGGFRERADHTYALLSDSATQFIVVAAPERDALREASYFVDRLDEEGMPLAGLVVNRVHRVSAPGLSAARALSAAEELDDIENGRSSNGRPSRSSGVSESTAITQALLRLHAVQAEIAGRHQALAKRFIAGHPDIPMVEVPAASQDIHDLVGLRAVGEALAGQ